MRDLRQGAKLRQVRQLLSQACQQTLAAQHPEDPGQARIEHTPGKGVHFVHPGRQSRQGLIVNQGVVKTYDPVTGVGIVVSDVDRSEVFLRPGSLKGSVFRTLRQGQRIIFDVVEEDGNSFVTTVRLGQDGY